MNTANKHQSTFDQGQLRSLELAVATFLRMQQEVPLELFREAYACNVATWEDTTLGMTVTDEYRQGMAVGAKKLSALLSVSRQSGA